jgi:hypothetical protein
MLSSMAPLNLFSSYSHKDGSLRKAHGAGAINRELDSADIISCMVMTWCNRDGALRSTAKESGRLVLGCVVPPGCSSDGGA